MDGFNSWLCAQTTSGMEAKLQSVFARVGVETYLPKARKHYFTTHYLTGERKSVTRPGPLFPGYVFARPDESGWLRLKSLEVAGAPRWVNFGFGPVVVPDDLIHDLQKSEVKGVISTSGLTQITDEPEYPTYRPGQVLELLSGPLKGLRGICESDSVTRVALLMNMLRVEAGKDNVALAS